MSGDNEIIVGRDSRLSSPKLFSYLTQGISSSGVNVIDIGIVPTAALYFATHKLNSSNVVVITGSHNPNNYNGFKIVINNVLVYVMSHNIYCFMFSYHIS